MRRAPILHKIIATIFLGIAWSILCFLDPDPLLILLGVGIIVIGVWIL